MEHPGWEEEIYIPHIALSAKISGLSFPSKRFVEKRDGHNKMEGKKDLVAKQMLAKDYVYHRRSSNKPPKNGWRLEILQNQSSRTGSEIFVHFLIVGGLSITLNWRKLFG